VIVPIFVLASFSDNPQLLREMNETDLPSAEVRPVSIYEVCCTNKGI
jgi:hypothetical protein